jgi:acetyltransferase-like isoleucine patch superfamily enzyme
MKVATWLGLDAGFLLILVAVVSPPLAAVAALVAALGLPAWAAAALIPVAALLVLTGMTATTALVRLCLPRLRAGSFPLAGPEGRAWMLHFALGRVARLTLWAPLYFSFSFLRFFLLRALGARAPYHLHTSSDAAILDAPLVTLGRGAMLGGGVVVCAHFQEEERLFLAPVTIGAGAQLLGGAVVSPGCAVGDDAVVGAGARLFPGVVLGAGAHVGAGSVLYNDAQVGENAVIGHHVTIEAGATIGAGAVVASGARVAKGAAIADGARVA